MNRNPLFSIIIPIYKVEKFIIKCVRSVLCQSYKNIEIVLVNDGSPDRCPEICEDLAKEDSRIKVIHCINSGVATARKRGCEAASGTYLIFLDGDDYLADNCCSMLEQHIRALPVDIICFGMYYDDGKKYKEHPLKYRYGYYQKNDIRNEIFPFLIQTYDAKYFPPSLCGKVIKKELFYDNVLADSKCIMGEDGACLIPCIFHAKSMIILEECLYFYRYNYESLTKGQTVIPIECPEIIYKHIQKHIDLGMIDFNEQLNRKLVHDLFTMTVSQFYRNEKYVNIAKSVKRNLNSKLYKTAINESKFSKSIAAKLMRIALKYRLYFLLYIYSKFRIKKI